MSTLSATKAGKTNVNYRTRGKEKIQEMQGSENQTKSSDLNERTTESPLDGNNKKADAQRMCQTRVL